MKSNLFIIVCLVFSFVHSQEKNDTVLKFFNYNQNMKNYEFDFEKKAISDSTIFQTLDSLRSIGFYTLTLDSIKSPNIYLNKGKMYKKIWVKNDSIFNKKEDWFAVQNLDSLVQNIQAKYANEGFPFSEFKIIPLGYKHGEVQVKLELNLFPQRTIDHIEVIGYEKLSKGFIRNNLGLKIGETYNEQKLLEASERISYSSFIKETNEPQTLFNTDSTTVYLYVEKVNSNSFDGILGFGNDENGDFQLNGNVKVELSNNFNGMEIIRLNWIATADKSNSLDLNVRIPYLFQSEIGTQTYFNMYKKDSTYVNLKIEERLFYQLNNYSNIGLNLSYETSNFVLDESPLIDNLYEDFNKTGIGASYEFLRPTQKRLMEGKSKLFILGKALRKKTSEFQVEVNDYFDTKIQQYEVGIDAFHLFQLHPQHYLKSSVEAFGLFGSEKELAMNELYRIGGFNSIRGFNEESIIASTYGVLSMEYRFMPNDGIYISTFGDYAFIENKSADFSENLFGVGVGFSFLTQLGIFNMSYAVGKQPNEGFDFKNSKIHFGILTRF